MYICICQGITDTQIREAISNGARSMKDLNRDLGVSIQCGKCGKEAKQLLRNTLTQSIGEAVVGVWRPAQNVPPLDDAALGVA